MANEKTNYAPLILLNMAVDTVNDWENEVICSNYVQKLSDAGAIPFCMPSIEKSTHIETLLDLADGVLLIGGKDYHPSYYGQEPHKETNLLRKRPHFDIALGEAVMRRNFPVLGICAGCQLLNIVTGGELIQHLPNADEAHRGGLFHKAAVVQDGFFSRALGICAGESVTVNSYHHQAVDPEKLGKGLQITARAFDGTVEVIEAIDPERMIMGLQFHPERMGEEMAGLFQLLVEKARHWHTAAK